jgi:hypothetical protein
MGTLLRIVLVVFALWLIVRYIKRALDAKSTPRHPSPNTAAHDNAMLPCKLCGVYLPQSEATRLRGNIYCSREHAEADNKT